MTIDRRAHHDWLASLTPAELQAELTEARGTAARERFMGAGLLSNAEAAQVLGFTITDQEAQP